MLVEIGFIAVLTGAVSQRFLATEGEAIEAGVAEEGETVTEILAELRPCASATHAAEFASEEERQPGADQVRIPPKTVSCRSQKAPSPPTKPTSPSPSAAR
jgi:hypothetical protein